MKVVEIELFERRRGAEESEILWFQAINVKYLQSWRIEILEEEA